MKLVHTVLASALQLKSKWFVVVRADIRPLKPRLKTPESVQLCVCVCVCVKPEPVAHLIGIYSMLYELDQLLILSLSEDWI